MIAARNLARNVLALWLFFLAAFLIADIDIISRNVIGAWFSVSAITALVGAVVVALVGKKIASKGRTFTVAQAALASLSMGLLLGIIQSLFAELLPIAAIREPILLIVSDTAAIGILGTGVILYLQVLRVDQQRRTEAIDDAIAITQARGEVADMAQRMRTALFEDIEAALSPARNGIAEQLADQERQLAEEEWPQVARQLRAAATDTIRPLSRRLWDVRAPELPPITLRTVVRKVIEQQPFQPVAIGLIVIATFFAGLVSTLGWVIGLAVLTFGVVFGMSILAIGNALMRRWPQHHAVIFVSAAIFTQIGHLIFFPVREFAGAPAYNWSEFGIASILGVILIFVISGFGSIRSFREDAARLLVAEIDQELADSISASRQLARLARESARILHGSVQTRLIACAVAMERAADTRDAGAFQTALQEAHAILADATGDHAANLDDVGVTVLAEEVQLKADLWSSLCRITVAIDDQAKAIDGSAARDTARIVEEGLSNAIRHGDASNITITITAHREQEQIDVVIADDGFGPQSGPRGLGSSLLDGLCQSWSLSPAHPGAVLNATRRR